MDTPSWLLFALVGGIALALSFPAALILLYATIRLTAKWGESTGVQLLTINGFALLAFAVLAWVLDLWGFAFAMVPAAILGATGTLLTHRHMSKTDA